MGDLTVFLGRISGGLQNVELEKLLGAQSSVGLWELQRHEC